MLKDAHHFFVVEGRSMDESAHCIVHLANVFENAIGVLTKGSFAFLF